jgi:NAD(P)-dependent dehydrogenase (short-subunit alcohol dehydrogenase family)
MRIFLVGASGVLGRAVAAELAPRHEIVSGGRNSGDVRIDITDADNIRAAFASLGTVDAVVCAAGSVRFEPLEAITAAPLASSVYGAGIHDKLMGQVNLALEARQHLADRGSITLISGVLTDSPIAAGSSASMVNGAIEAFVRAAAIELPRGLRINAVSPGVLLESMPHYAPFFRGFEPVPAARAALAYGRSVEGLETGKVYRVF